MKRLSLCTCYDGGCAACVAAYKAREAEMRAEAYAKGIEDAALTVEAYAETRIPTFWTALRHAARQIRALKRDGACSAKAEGK